jgi:hypothetical protein
VFASSALHTTAAADRCKDTNPLCNRTCVCASIEDTTNPACLYRPLAATVATRCTCDPLLIAAKRPQCKIWLWSLCLECTHTHTPRTTLTSAGLRGHPTSALPTRALAHCLDESWQDYALSSATVESTHALKSTLLARGPEQRERPGLPGGHFVARCT